MASSQDLQVMSPSAAAAEENGVDATMSVVATPTNQFRQASPRTGSGVIVSAEPTSNRSEPYPIFPPVPSPPRVQGNTNAVETPMASDNDLQLALRLAAGSPIPDTTPPEERQLREENRLRQQIQDVRDDARHAAHRVLEEQRAAYRRHAEDYHRAMTDNTTAELAAQRASLTGSFNSALSSVTQRANAAVARQQQTLAAVSYTHLTLPTIHLV